MLSIVLNAEDVFRADVVRELEWIKRFAQPRFPSELSHSELYEYQKVSPTDHVESLRKYLEIVPNVLPTASNEEYLLRPTLRHPDLQPHNIFVAEDYTITGLIDWQHCSILPLLLQAGVPDYFQNYGDDDSEYLRKPTLPENFNEMNEEEQGQALEQFRRRQLHFYYFAGTRRHYRPHFDALWLDSTLSKQRLYRYASSPWEGNNISLKARLIHATRHWNAFFSSTEGTAQQCPISFSEEEAETFQRLYADQQEIDAGIEHFRNRIGISQDGWTSHERYHDALVENRLIKEQCIDGEDEETKKTFWLTGHSMITRNINQIRVSSSKAFSKELVRSFSSCRRLA